MFALKMCKCTYGKNIFVANINFGRSFLDLSENVFVYRRNFLVAAINLTVLVSISDFALILFLSYKTLII